MGEIFLLTVLCAVTAGVFAQDVVPCMRTQQECRTMTSGLMIINNKWMCCAAGYSMQFNGDCSCRKTAEVRPCDVGLQACRGAASMSSNVNGVLRCCQLGYSMQSVNAFVNGQAVDSCTCSRSIFNGIVGNNIIIDGNTMVVNGSYGHFNSTEFQQHMATFGQRMREWGQRFQANMQSMGDRLRQSLSWLG